MFYFLVFEKAFYKNAPIIAEKVYPKILEKFWFVAIAFFVIYFFVRLIYEIYYYKKYYYADNNELLTLRKGVFKIVTLTIPYNKVQHIFIDQDLFDRIFGLWDVHLASAGTIGMELHIDGLKKEHAEGLRNLLIQRTIYKGKTKR